MHNHSHPVNLSWDVVKSSFDVHKCSNRQAFMPQLLPCKQKLVRLMGRKSLGEVYPFLLAFGIKPTFSHLHAFRTHPSIKLVPKSLTNFPVIDTPTLYKRTGHIPFRLGDIYGMKYFHSSVKISTKHKKLFTKNHYWNYCSNMRETFIIHYRFNERVVVRYEKHHNLKFNNTEGKTSTSSTI